MAGLWFSLGSGMTGPWPGYLQETRKSQDPALHVPKRSGAGAEGPDAQDCWARKWERGVAMTTRGQSSQAPGSRRAPVLPGATCYHLLEIQSRSFQTVASREWLQDMLL